MLLPLRRTALWALLLVVMLTAEGRAITILHTENDSAYRALGAEYTSVGLITTKSHLGSGVLIGDQWVLTAAHVVDTGPAKNYTFSIGGSTYTGAAKYVFPTWTGNLFAGNDIALLQLKAPVSGIDPALLYTGSDELGMLATAVGYGRYGDGLNGATGFDFNVRGANNMIDSTAAPFGGSANILLTDFDSGLDGDNFLGSASPVFLEGMIAPGDSGGGLFSNIDGIDYLLGIHSFLWAPLDGATNSDYGDVGGHTRVAAFNEWVLSIISGDSGGKGNGGGGKGNGNGKGPKNAQVTVAVTPEPSTLALMGLAGLALLRRRR